MGGGVCYSKISGGCFGNTPTSSFSLSNSKNFWKNFFIFFLSCYYFFVSLPLSDHHYCSKSGFRCSSKLKSSRCILVGI
nr:MAG TPA: hypothetical protein [Caudoviricetes sp.]